MDRLLYPPRTTRFPFIDILLLILISLMSFALKQGSILYVSGVVGALIFIWALMIRGIIRENSDSMSEDVKSALNGEVKQRVILGSLFIIVAALSYFSNLVGINVFVGLVLFVMAWNAIVSLRTKRRRQNEK